MKISQTFFCLPVAVSVKMFLQYSFWICPDILEIIYYSTDNLYCNLKAGKYSYNSLYPILYTLGVGKSTSKIQTLRKMSWTSTLSSFIVNAVLEWSTDVIHSFKGEFNFKEVTQTVWISVKKCGTIYGLIYRAWK